MASRKMAARGDGADLIAVGERESSGVATGPAGTGGDAQREMESVLTALHSWEAVECRLKTEAAFI